MKLDDIEKAAKDCVEMLASPEFRKPILDRFQLGLEPEFAVKLIALVRVQHEALSGLTEAIKNMKAPQTIDDVALQVFVTIGPALETASAALKQYEDFDLR